MDRCRLKGTSEAYVDGQLDERERGAFEAHLGSCSVCQQEVARLRTLQEALQAWQAPAADPGFENAVRNTIVSHELERGTKMEKKTFFQLVPAGVVAGIVVAIAVGSLVTQPLYKRGLQGRLKSATDDIGDMRLRAAGGAGTSSGKGDVLYGMSDMSKQRPEELKEKDGSFAGEYAARLAAPTTIPYKKVANGLTESEGVQGQGTVIVVEPTLPATGVGDYIIRTADVRLEVENGKETYAGLARVCQEMGGYLASSNFYRDVDGRESGNVIMRIPKDKFLTTLDKLGTLGKVVSSNTGSSDVGQQYANLKARLDAAMVVYKKMLEALNKRQATIPEAMRTESELTPVMEKIQALKNEIEVLNNQVSFTTISVTFSEPQISAKLIKESGRSIKDSLIIAKVNAIRTLARLITALPAIVTLIVLGVIVTAVVAAVGKKFRK